MAVLASKKTRLQRRDWLDVALTALVEDGVGGVAIERLADTLGVTRGSFYYHFKDRDDLLHELLAYWEQRWTVEIGEEIAALGLDPVQSLLALSRMIRHRRAAEYDTVFRAWALHDPVARKVVKRVDEYRLGVIRDLFERGGFKGLEAENCARGPSGATPEMGTQYAVEHFLKAFNWDLQTRNFRLNPGPGKIEVFEFDYKGKNEVVYEENGVTIRSWPAIHAGDGPVSFALEWNGMKIVIGGDTFPNKWFVKYATGADVAIPECFLTPDALVDWYNQSPEQAIGVGTQVHTSPQAFGKVMSEIKPRHAIAYHFFNEEGTRYGIYDGVRETYDGPISLATDNMVWNITKDEIVERMTVSPDEAWSVPGPTPPPAPLKEGVPDPLSDEMKAGMWNPQTQEAQQQLVDEFNKKYNLQ